MQQVYFLMLLRSKNGFLALALTGIAIMQVQSGIHPSARAAYPAEYITRVSRRRSAAVAQAEPNAIPTSTRFIAQGVPSLLLSQVFAPQ